MIGIINTLSFEVKTKKSGRYETARTFLQKRHLLPMRIKNAGTISEKNSTHDSLNVVRLMPVCTAAGESPGKYSAPTIGEN